MKIVMVWLCLLLVLGIGWAEKVETMPAPTGYVDDYAGVLSSSARDKIEGLCKEVHAKTKAQVFFVTVKTLDGEAMEPFANELFHKWKIGEKKTDRGILLILAIAEHQRRIEVGYGLEGILNDAKVGDIGREMVPSLKDSNYDEAAWIGVQDVSKAIGDDSNVSLDALKDGVGAPVQSSSGKQEDNDGSRVSSVFAAVPFVLFLGVFGWVVWRSMKNRSPSGGSGGWSGGGGGSDGGSGDSGGGSGSFSGGDGGDSGGGGAGGSW